MSSKIKIIFLILVLVQGLHSVEEYIGRLWEVFPPARILSSPFSENPEIIFLIFNIGFFIFGIWCWYFPVRREYTFARGLIWFWIVIEMINGIGHSVWAIYEKTYIPGVVTSPILFIISIYLFTHLLFINPTPNKK